MKEEFDPKKRFNERATVYDADVLKIIPSYAALHETVRHLLETSMPENAFVLVAGVGTGNETVSLAERNPGWRVTGFDIAENMIDTATAKVEARGLGHRVELVHGTINDVFQEAFDGATALLVMHFIPYAQKLSFLREINFRLRPGGTLLLADFTGDRGSFEFESFVTAWEDYMLERREKSDVDETVGHTRRDLDILSHASMVELIQRAGFLHPRLFWKSLVFSAYIAEKGE